MRRRSFFAGIVALATGAAAVPASVAANEAKPKLPTGGGFTADELKAISNAAFADRRDRDFQWKAYDVNGEIGYVEVGAHSHPIFVDPKDRGRHLRLNERTRTFEWV